MARYRNEWKYGCCEGELALLENRLRGALCLDPHSGSEGRYAIHSLYFDDYHDSCASENEAGIMHRFKYRIRYYGDALSSLHLERKEKHGQMCVKHACPLSMEEYRLLARGDAAALLHETDKPLLKQLCLAMMTRHFAPKIIIDYEWTAYIEPSTNVRITFDRHISASASVDAFVRGGYLRCPLQEDGRQILEVKFDDILPGHIRRLLDAGALEQISFSKYYLGRKTIGAFSL